MELSAEYARLAHEDEQASKLLHDSGNYRHAMYFAIQAMEKYVRAKVFSLVDGKNYDVRYRHRNHSIEGALDSLVEVVNHDPIVREQVTKQLQQYVIGETRFNHLHNNLRYPAYFEKYQIYSSLDVTRRDSIELLQKLDTLKRFLAELDRVLSTTYN